MDISTFTTLLSQPESETLEFKRELPASSDLAVLISAFYNTAGGTLIVGVDDAHRPVGAARAQGVEAGIVNILSDRLDLNAPPAIEIVTYQGQEFVVVTCPKGTRRPYLVRGQARPHVRIGSTCREATNEEIRNLYVEDAGLSYESMAVPGATMDDISPERVAWYVTRRTRGGQLPPGPLPELLAKLGVLTPVGNITLPTAAGLLLFGKEPQRFLPHATLRVARFLGNDMATFLDQADVIGTIPQMIDEAEKFVTRNTRHGIRIVGFRHVNVHEYPIEAIREAITNALCHRDWGLIGQQVRVAIFDDRIFVDSPGRLPPGVTLENIERVHVLRNPVIAQLLYDVEYIENWGSGVPRMKRAMAAYDLPQPVFEEPGPNFTATFSGPGERFMRELEAKPVWMAGLNERQIKAMEYLAERGKITNREYRQMFSISQETAANDLAVLVERSLVKRHGSGRSTVYHLISDET
jgi:ATP-dependent DNA helicase RecG